MKQETKQDTDQEDKQSEVAEKKLLSRIKKYSFGTTCSIFATCALLVILVSGVTYWCVSRGAESEIKTKNDKITSLETEITELEKDLATEKTIALGSDASDDNQDSCVSTAPNDTAQENIIASITSGNTQPLEGYSASSVNVILAATEAYGAQTQTQAVSDITSFISGATSPWDFSLSASILSSYGSSGYGQYFPNNAIVGKSADGRVISFSFDCDGKINQVFLASSEEIIGN